MIDTVNIQLPAPTGYSRYGQSYLSDVSYTQSLYGDFYVGSLGSLKVKIKQNKVEIKDRSLCKWHLGDNIQTMMRTDIEDAIIKLSDVLHLDVRKGSVTRLDIADNLFVDHPVNTYFKNLSECSRLDRSLLRNTLYYTNNEKTYCIYDKIEENSSHKNKTPKELKNSNIMRLELRYLHRVNEAFSVPKVSVDMLYDEVFYRKMVNNWYEQYSMISKINTPNIDFGSVKSVKDLQNLLALASIEKLGGINSVITTINDARCCDDITSTNATRMRQWVEKLFNEPSLCGEENEAIKELDWKMRCAVEFYL